MTRVPQWLTESEPEPAQAVIEREFLRWCSWLAVEEDDRRRLRPLVLRVPPWAFETPAHRRLYEAVRAAIVAGRRPTLVALLDAAGNDVRRLGGWLVLDLLSEMPHGVRQPEGTWLQTAEEQAGWLCERARERRWVHELELALEAARRGDREASLRHARAAFGGGKAARRRAG